MAILHIFSIAIITLVILKREKILQNLSHFGKKRDEHKKEERTILKESDKNELEDELVQKEAKTASKAASTQNNVASSKVESAIGGSVFTVFCPNCNKMVVPDKFFCTWCEAFIPNPSVGKKSGFFRRWLATAIDPIIALILYSIILVTIATISKNASIVIAAYIIVEIGYLVFFFWLLSKGMTPGKWLLGEQVVEKFTGNYPGFWRMILREIVGKFVSGLPLALGYFWAIWDKDGQAWHDKIAGTVVVKRS